MSGSDTSLITFSEQIIKNHGRQVQILFKIGYPFADIDRRFEYAIRVRIEAGRKLWLINMTCYEVIEWGNPAETIEVVL